LGDDAVPDESTILRFRHLLEQHELTQAIFAEVRHLLDTKGLLVKSGTIVDATIISAPSSTKNATGTRDPEMRQTRQGNQWYFGMKVHVGTDLQGIVHTLTTTDAAQADCTQTAELLHGDERELYGDRAYWNSADEPVLEAAGIAYRVNRRGILSAAWRAINCERSRCRARGEHAFHVVKRLWGFRTVRYRGLRKNTARVYALFALANLYLLRKKLVPC
jgi:IS5 family transposase